MLTKRRGLTLLEVVVMLTIIVILAGLLLPAIKGARERRHRVNCLNNLKEIGLACHLYANDWRDSFPFAVGGDDSNGHFYLLFPNYITSTKPFVCISDYEHTPRSAPNKCRDPASAMNAAAWDKPNVNSYAYVAGLTEKSSGDSPLAGDNLVNVSKANDPSVRQYQKRVTCSTKGSSHDATGGNVVFVDGHGTWIAGGARWVDGAGGTKNIKNPNGL